MPDNVRVRFYRAEPRLTNDKPWPNDEFPRSELRKAVTDRKDSTDRYVRVGYDTLLCVPGEHAPARDAFTFYKVRHDHLPDQERAGEVTRLGLPSDANLAEAAHVVMFDRNIVGICRRLESPGRAVIGHYIDKVLRNHNPKRTVVFAPIVRPDVMQLLQNRELVSATVKVAAGNADAIARASRTAGEATRSLARESSSTAVTFTLHAGRSVQERRAFRQRVLSTILGPIHARERPHVEKLEVEYISTDSGRQVINLLGDDISVFAHVELPAGRRFVTPQAGYQAIREAYGEALAELNAALQLG